MLADALTAVFRAKPHCVLLLVLLGRAPNVVVARKPRIPVVLKGACRQTKQQYSMMLLANKALCYVPKPESYKALCIEAETCLLHDYECVVSPHSLYKHQQFLLCSVPSWSCTAQEMPYN